MVTIVSAFRPPLSRPLSVFPVKKEQMVMRTWRIALLRKAEETFWRDEGSQKHHVCGIAMVMVDYQLRTCEDDYSSGKVGFC